MHFVGSPNISYRFLSIQSICDEKLPTITLNEKITDTIWIYAIYRIFGFSVKSGSRHMRL
jgi:hypothetical protein